MCQNNEFDSPFEEISVDYNSSADNQLKYSSLTFLGNSTPDISSIKGSSSQSERIKTIKYKYDIIGLLSKCQQAIVLFSTLFQELNTHNKEAINSFNFGDVTNELFFQLLIAKIESIHDREIKLNQNDCNSFVFQVNQRNDLKIPILINKCEENNGRFRCFSKKLNSNNSLIISIIPSTFKDLKYLIFGNEIQSESSTDSLNKYHVIDENQNSNDSLYGSLSLPIFIYKTSFTTLSEQLLEGKRWKDIYLENINKSVKNDFSNHPFKPFKSNETENEFLSKGSLIHFCQSLQMIYWNSMTQSLYRSLQFGYIIDKRDILKIVENISDKIVLNIDISRFLIYICQHFKEYFMKIHSNEPNFDINDLIKTNLNESNTSSTKNSDNFEDIKNISFKDIIESTNSCLDYRELHSDIKEKFQKTLQNYFSPIPCFPSYYFFNCKQKLNFNQNSFNDLNIIDKSLMNSAADYDLPKVGAINTEAKVNKNDKISDDSCSYSTLKSFVKNETQEENASLSKSNSSKVSYNPFDLTSEETSSMPNLCTNTNTETSTTDTYLDISCQPLFLRLSCSVRTEISCEECSPNFLPTCLQEIIALLDSDNYSGFY